MTARDIYIKVRDYMDDQVSGLSPEEYLEFLDILAGDIESREEATKQELEDADS